MKSFFQAVALSAVTCGLIVCLSASVQAAETTSAAQKLSVTLNGSVTDAAAQLAASAGTPVLVDPAVRGEVTGTFNSSSVDEVMDAVCASVKAKWVKAFIPQETAKADELKTAKDQVAALETLRAAKPVMVYDPASKSQIILTRTAPDPAQDAEDAHSLGLRPVYLIYAPPPPPKPAATTASDKTPSGYANLEKRQQDEFLKMTPEERAKALEQSLADEMATDPTTRAEYMRARMEAMNALRQSNSPIYQQWRESQRQRWSEMGGGRGGWRGGDGGPGGPGNRRNRSEGPPAPAQ